MTRGNKRGRGICIEQLQDRMLFSSGVLSLTNSVILTGGTVSVSAGATLSKLGPGLFTNNFIPFYPGDANQDGVVDTLDFNSIAANYGHKGDWSKGDFSGDGKINGSDLNLIATHFGQRAMWTGTLGGDANLDGTVSTGAGDFNFDGVVDTLDFNVLKSNFGVPITGG